MSQRWQTNKRTTIVDSIGALFKTGKPVRTARVGLARSRTSLRVVFLGTRGIPNIQGGVERHCEGLAAALAKRGCQVTVITRRPYVDPTLREWQGVRLISIPALRHKALETFLHTLLGVFAAFRYRPDVLHIQAIGPGLFVPLARCLGFKVVLTSHGSNYKHLKWGWGGKTVLRLGEVLGVTFAHRVIAVSGQIAREIEQGYGKQAAVIPNGIWLARNVGGCEMLQRFELQPGRFILSVGRLVPEKGFQDLIEAFDRLQQSHPNVHDEGWKLVIVGGADHEDDYSKRIRELAARTGAVTLTDFLSGEALWQLYTHASLFVLPSYYEGLPIALLEAMSYGLSCLASDIPAHQEIGLGVGRYFQAGDVDGLANKLQEFLGRLLPEQERVEQVDRVLQQYDWDVIAEQTLEIYRAVALNTTLGHNSSVNA